MGYLPTAPHFSSVAPSAHLAALCSTLLRLLRSYEALILTTETQILGRSADFVANGAFVSLATVRAAFAQWEAPLAALDRLVDSLVRGPEHERQTPSVTASTQGPSSHDHRTAPPRSSVQWTGGLLIDLLSQRADTGVGRVSECMCALRAAVEESWLNRLVAWVCYGDDGTAALDERQGNSQLRDALVEWNDSGSEPLTSKGASPATPEAESQVEALVDSPWRFRPHALPRSISATTADAILYVGRALSTVRYSSAAAASSAGAHVPHRSSARSVSTSARALPEGLTAQHVQLLRNANARPSQPLEFAQAIARIRDDVSEWLWRNVLTTETVVGALEAL